MSQRSEFARLVRELRRDQKLSLRDLGTKANVDFTYISKIENDTYVPSTDTIHRIAAAVEATPAQVRRLIETADKRREHPVTLAPAPSRDAQILLRRIYSGAVTKAQFKEMLRVVEGDGTEARRRRQAAAAQNGQEPLLSS